MNEKIFISIPSFRDPTLAITLKSALLHAENPENLIFAIGLQYYDDEMPDLSFVPANQLRILKYDVDTRPGVVRVRYEISKLYVDEKYLFMIDSHTLFSPSWDKILKESLSEIEQISGHNNVSISGNGSVETYNYFESKRYIFDPTAQEIKTFETIDFVKHGEYTRSHHVDCSYFFTYGRYNIEVGLDPYSHFLHEELYMSWRTFMSGWDVHVPSKRYARQSPHAYFNLIWEDNNTSRTYTRQENKAQKIDELEMILAFAYNKGKFAIKDAARKTSEFWEYVKAEDSYNNMLISPQLRRALIEYDLYHHLVTMA